jgi:hypothetical protein
MNWGYKIALAYLVFVGGMLFLVFKANSQKFDLVVNDYYEQELKYQEVIDQKQRAATLSTAAEVTYQNGRLAVAFPEEFRSQKIEGELYLYRPSDARRDLKRSFSLSELHYATDIQSLSGLYEIRLSWNVNGKTYFQEQKKFF